MNTHDNPRYVKPAPEVLTGEDDATFWVSADFAREAAAIAFTEFFAIEWPGEDAIAPEDLTLVGMRPVTAQDRSEHEWIDEFAFEIECPVDHPDKAGEYWRWRE